MFKSLIKICYYPLRIITTITLILSLAIGGIVFYIFSTGNTGELTKQEVVNYLQKQGLEVEVDSIKFSPTTGFTLNNIFWQGNANGNTIFIQAKEVILGGDLFSLAFSDLLIENIAVKDALVSFYFNDQKPPLHLKDLNFNLNLNKRSWELFDSSLRFNTCKISYKGTINKPEFDPSTEINFPKIIEQTLSNLSEYYTQVNKTQKTLPLVWEHLRNLHKNSKEQNYPIKIDLSFNLPWSNPLNGSIVADINIPRHLIRGVEIKNVNGDIIFKNNILSAENFKVEIDEKESLNLTTSYNFSTTEIKASGNASIYPERVATLLSGHLPTVAKYTQLVKSFGKPINATLNLPSQKIFSPNLYTNISVDAENIVYDKNLKIDKVDGELKVNSNSLDFDIKKVVFNNQKTSGECQGIYLFKVGELILKTQVTGDPTFAASFMPGFVANVFLDICNSFKWEKSSPPFFDLSLRNTHHTDYITQLNGTISMARTKLFKTPLKMLHTGLNLQITNEHQYALLHDLSLITQNGKNITGNGVYDFDFDKDVGSASFSAKGTTSPNELFKILTLDNFAEAIDFLDFKDDLDFKLDGTFDFDQPELSSIHAKLNAKSVDIFKHNLKNTRPEIDLIGSRLIVNKIDGILCGGESSSRFEYDFNTDKSALNIVAKKLDLNQVPSLSGKTAGFGDLELNMGLHFREDLNAPILSGGGEFSIKEGNFWKIPILSSLANAMGKVFPTKGLGEITQIDSKLEFSEHTVKIKDLDTNGSIISFRGGGNVLLDQRQVDVMLETRPLADVLWNVIPILLRPITKSIQINLKGDFDNLKWEAASGLW